MRILRKDDRVSHTQFGLGVVIEVDARYTVIEFDEEGVKIPHHAGTTRTQRPAPPGQACATSAQAIR